MINLKTLGIAVTCVITGFAAGFMTGKKATTKVILPGPNPRTQLLLDKGREPIEIKFEKN